MSFCRWGDGSDVYVYHAIGGYLTCCGCGLDLNERDQADSFTTTDPAEMVAHLERHIENGHLVPDDVIPEIAGMTEADVRTGEPTAAQQAAIIREVEAAGLRR